MFDYANSCYETGLLTENFRCAKIRLIPKKGDATQLKNWRPTSLLNCFYKLISRVVALRLCTVIDKITKVGQKGFSGSKYCQEVLIGIVDTINHVKFRNKRGVLLSLDIRKAFDSTSHSYLQMVYQFFNFGPNFMRWLNLIGTNRKACIILGNGIYSEFFDLERGNAQGDTTSPYIFNLGFQILILKLTFDLQIEGIVEYPTIPVNIPPLPRTVSTYARKVSAYADDASLIVKCNYNNLLRIKTILEDFGTMSGLICNVEKTVLLPIGNDTVIDNNILSLGFTVVDTVTILGLEIDRNGYKQSNFSKIVDKVRNQIATWRPFNLSLPGRVSISKTMLYSQINYLGCFLPLPQETLIMIEDLIVNFVKGPINIARKRVFLPVENGGLGLFPVRDFIDAQKCTWIKRSTDYSEPWKVIIYVSNFGNIFNCKYKNVNKDEFPICHDIFNSYERLMNIFTTSQENFNKSYIFENNNFTVGLRSKEQLNHKQFVDEVFDRIASKLYSLRYCDLFDEQNVFLTSEMINAQLGINLTQLQCFNFRNSCSAAKVRYSKKDIDMRKSVNIETFLYQRKRGSSHLRKILLNIGELGIPHNINKFARNMDIVIDGDQAKFLNSLWVNTLFTSQEKTFFFKLHNNTLGFNNAVAHFVAGHSPNCTFCNLTLSPEHNPETPSHLFFECRSVTDLIDNIFTSVTGNEGFKFNRREFFTRFERRELTHPMNQCLTLFSKFLIKYLWDCRSRNFVLTLEHCWESMCDKITLAGKVNKKFNNLWSAAGNFTINLHANNP